ncbi:MAG TPA: DUF5985 family protein [Candidatus Kapabacteria bacterium]|nr:DUF5985 family protein [Candidatus Kapabacteria bacterium]
MNYLSMVIGIIVMGYAVGALFFFRFWRESRDRLFLMFGIAFAALALQELLYGMTNEASQSPALLYLIRLIAFVIILAGILDKNLKARRK